MKLLISKNEENIIVKVVKDNVEMDFDYITFVDDLYNDVVIEEIEYTDEIVDWEKSKINDLINKIKKAIIIDEEENENNADATIDLGIGAELNGELLEESELFRETVE